MDIMLSYRGNKQIPRKYPLPEDTPTNSFESSTCDHCSSFIFTPLFSTSLLATWEAKEEVFAFSYERSSEEIRQSCIDGCKWCNGLANGILTFAYLENVYERWNQSDSSDDFDSCTQMTGGQEEHTSGDFESDEDLPIRNRDESISDLDPLGVFELSGELDILQYESEFRVEITLRRSEKPYFTILVVRIEPSIFGRANLLQDLLYDQVIELTYHLHGIGTVCERVLSPLKRDFNLYSEENFQAASTWIKSRSNVKAKHIDDHRNFVPTRLIDVDSRDNPYLTLSSELFGRGNVSSKNLDYVALSYVWGVDQSFVLTKNSIDEMMVGLHMNVLPKTITDAIRVIRRLGFKYLWVDALCIIQDSDVDKVSEISKMRLVYQHAALAIVAAVASSAAEGFLHGGQPPTYSIQPFEIPLISKNGHLERMSLSYPASYKRWKDPINSRAWTLQELLLSPYILIYSYSGVQMIERSTLNDISDTISGSNSLNMTSLTWNTPLFPIEDYAITTLREIWLAIRDEYSRRQLTYGRDKLIAIAAIAEEFGTFWTAKYIAGLWETDFVLDLQWRRRLPDTDNDNDVAYKESRLLQARPLDYRAPSWSWASIDGEVCVHDEEDVFQQPFHFHVRSWTVDPVDPTFPYGAICRGAKLEVEGLLLTFLWRPTSNPIIDQCDGLLAVMQSDDDGGGGQIEYKIGEATLDATEPDLVSGAVVSCLALSLVGRIPGRVEVEGLMLSPIDSACYRRIGFFKIYSRDIFEAGEVRQITII